VTRPRARGPSQTFRPTGRRVRTIVVRLEQAYGRRPWEPDGDPLGGLVWTILSQHTNDTNSLAAYTELTESFPTWEEVLAAPPRHIERAIRTGGLARTKARRIKDILVQILAEHGHLDLDFLVDWPDRRALEYLCAFKGVGPKTAACVLMFNLGKPILPVDTHIHRISGRLGLIGPDVSAEEAHGVLQAICPAPLVWPFHVLMIQHGRQTCRARRPLCPACNLRDICPAGLAYVP
jgi:endonuclease-3